MTHANGCFLEADIIKYDCFVNILVFNPEKLYCELDKYLTQAGDSIRIFIIKWGLENETDQPARTPLGNRTFYSHCGWA